MAFVAREATLTPLVSIVMPIRNEARHIGRCLEAVLAQDYAAEQIEVLIADGMSADATRARIEETLEHARAAGRPARQLQLIDNPERIVSTALNRAIRLAHGEIILRVDGHCVIAPDYVRRCVEGLQTIAADCVGGTIQTVGETPVARAIALAQSAPFGVGGARFRYTTVPGYVDTLAFGAYRRVVFERIGLFDEELVRNQDDEFNLRLTRAGGKIWLDPQIRSTYYSRATLRALARQYFEYGFWKVRVIQKHGRPASWRHLVPALFWGVLVLALAASVITGSAWWIAAVVLPYVGACLVAAAVLAARHGWHALVYAPPAFMAMHLAYGAGFWAGLVRWGLAHQATEAPRAEWTR